MYLRQAEMELRVPVKTIKGESEDYHGKNISTGAILTFEIWNGPTMKDALVGFCGCLKMRKVLSSRMTPMMQVTTMIQGSFALRAGKPWVKMTQSPIKHTTEEKERCR